MVPTNNLATAVGHDHGHLLDEKETVLKVRQKDARVLLNSCVNRSCLTYRGLLKTQIVDLFKRHNTISVAKEVKTIC